MSRLILVIYCLSVLSCSRQPAGKNSNALFEASVLRGDWRALAGISGPDIAGKFAQAHALFALNRNSEAVCIILELDNDSARAAWLVWTQHFVDQHRGKAIAHFLYGDALARAGQWKNAAGEFGLALKLDPKLYLALNARGVVHALTGETDRALVDFEEAQAVNPRFAEAYASKGYLFIQQGGPVEGASRAFEHALSLATNYGLPTIGRGYLQLLKGKAAGAEIIQSASRVHSCVAGLAASDLLTWSESLGADHATQLAASGLPAGTTLRSELTKALQGDPAAMKRVAAQAANDPAIQKQVELTVKDASRHNPKAAEAYGRAVNERVVQLELKKDIVSAARGVQLEGGVGLSAEGGAKISPKTGVVNGGIGGKGTIAIDTRIKVDLNKALAETDTNVRKQLEAAKALQRSSEPAKADIGGVSTSLLAVRYDRGQWPRLIHYGLLYPSAVQSGKDRR